MHGLKLRREARNDNRAGGDGGSGRVEGHSERCGCLRSNVDTNVLCSIGREGEARSYRFLQHVKQGSSHICSVGKRWVREGHKLTASLTACIGHSVQVDVRCAHFKKHKWYAHIIERLSKNTGGTQRVARAAQRRENIGILTEKSGAVEMRLCNGSGQTRHSDLNTCTNGQLRANRGGKSAAKGLCQSVVGYRSSSTREHEICSELAIGVPAKDLGQMRMSSYSQAINTNKNVILVRAMTMIHAYCISHALV